MLSGATGLIYEVLWARMLGLVFGATTIAISAVLAAFMGGLALGSEIAGRRGARLRRPLRAYGVIEIVIGLYGLLVPMLFRGIDSVYAGIWSRFHPGFYGFAFSRFLLASLVLALPTILMGATLPVLSTALARSHRGATAVARFYTYNLIGAIIGALICGFVLLPSLGVRATIWVAAAINLVIGVGAILIDRTQFGEDTEPQPLVTQGDAEVAHSGTGQMFWLACAFVSGFITFSVQITWSRLLSMIIGSSTYAFSIVVALFLLGLALGAYFVSRGKTSSDHDRLRRAIFGVEVATAASLVVSISITNIIPALLVAIGFKLGINSWLGLLSLQVFISTLLVLVPAVLMGMIMPLVLVWAAGHRRSTSGFQTSTSAVGRAYAINTLGAIIGSVTTAFFLIPVTGSRFTILFAATLSIMVAGIAFVPRARKVDPSLARALSIGAAVVIILAMFVVAPRLNGNTLSIGAYDSYVRVLAKSRTATPENADQTGAQQHQVLMFKEGMTATVSVRRDWGITSLGINGRTNASDAEDMPTQVMVGQIGVLTARRLDNALVVGFASGVTIGSILQSSLPTVECVEIEKAAVASSHFFDHVNNRPLEDPRMHLIIDDARTYLRVNPTRYDIIVSEPSHPWVPGVANLFTQEFLELGRDRLRDDGVFVQWLQTYQLSTESLQSVLATFHQTFPHVLVFRVYGDAKGKDVILVGSRVPINLDRVAERMSNPRIAADLNRVGIKSPDDVRAWFVCDETRLGPAVAGAIINTDDNMHVETVAPREAFRPMTEENAAWLDRLRKP